MKINCSKCGKRFDADQYMYICPKCNHYHSQVGVRSKMTASVLPAKTDIFEEKPNDTADEGSEFIQTLNGDQKVYTAVLPKKSESTFDPGSVLKKIGLGICIVIGFVMFIGSTIADFDSWSDDSGSWGDGWDTYSTEEEVTYGSPMEFEDFTVNVGDVTELTDENLDVNEGWKLVKVSFETDSIYTAEDEDLFTDVVMLHSYGDDSNWTEDGYYALYEDEVTNERKVEEQLAEDGLVTEAHYSGSYFWVFEIPENAEEVKLKVTTYVPDGEWGSYSQDEAITMPLEL